MPTDMSRNVIILNSSVEQVKLLLALLKAISKGVALKLQIPWS